ncbi:MAG: tyrosine--tRNA ligase [Verrucomicrobia bacterium]|jgi:tyrosyl-tRNA synthetase|nr:tyrosine--tRNA ligase [Verrucomicrobiota bacterium]
MSLIETIRFNTETVIGETELEDRLHGSKPLRIKLGVDPTRPDLTFGHLVVFNKLRQFQDLGHEAVLIIGDFTTLIGDPSGRSSTRPVLSKEAIVENAQTYLDQAFKILDEEKATVYYNSEWFDKMRFEDCLKLSRKMTVARMLERDDFAKRYATQAPISIIEFLYPLIQGYDSLVLNADVEIGGTDQLFNMLVGRALQKDAGKLEQAVITMPLLVGLDGEKKMSKSSDNYIAFTDSAKAMFGKIMSIPDDTMWDYYRLLLELSDEKIEKLKAGHPMEAKKHLASSLVGQFHSMRAAKHELEQFEQVFSRNQLPDDMPVFTWTDLVGDAASAPLFEVMAQSELFESKGAIRRLVQQGAVKIDGEKQADPNRELTPPQGDQIFQAGKRIFFKVVG